ncbi:MAG: hypothetical protein LWX52_16405 [Deltaproteobacteria bacterium]|nr:hypothetical protein [Deltaproteobacteria bacterium]
MKKSNTQKKEKYNYYCAKNKNGVNKIHINVKARNAQNANTKDDSYQRILFFPKTVHDKRFRAPNQVALDRVAPKHL